MERSKRTPKTPKRFEDEAFEAPPRQQHHQPPPEPSPEQVAVTPKNIIKIKLNKSKPLIPRTPKETPKLKETPKPKEAIKPKEVLVKPKELLKPKEAAKPKDTIKTPKEAVKPKETIKPKEAIKIKDFPKIDTSKIPEQRDPQLVYRPKMKRPHTPPIYPDLIPNTILPFWDARTAAEDHEDDNVKELVHCHCSVAEELGLMVQCETCLTWQHAHCLGIEKAEEAPDGYTCRACSDPKFARESMKWAYDQDWLTKGRMKQFPCDSRPTSEKKSNTLKQINQLIANVLNIHHIIHSLKIKARILVEAGDEDADLKLFKTQWPASYHHRDGTPFIPTINNPSSTPASTLSAIVDTPDPGDITVETVIDGPLPDIAQLDDVSAILESPFVSQPPIQPMALNSNHEATPNDCRSNLRLHIQQTEEFISMELTQIEEQLTELEKECSEDRKDVLVPSLDSLKNDLSSIKNYINLYRRPENDSDM